MRYGLNILNFWDQLGHPKMIQDIARRAEAAGWDGLFTWDTALAHWEQVPHTYDPFVLLAGAACVTERLVLGTNVTPVPRRRPLVLGNQVATLDALAGGGRVLLGVGIGGDPRELELLGEVVDAKERAALLEAGLVTIRERWAGPIWVGGDSRPARRRAARFQGWTTGLMTDMQGTRGVTPELFAEKVALVLEHRAGATEPFDVLVEGHSTPTDGAMVAEYADAGATWWCDSIHGMRAAIPDLLARVDAGPPR